VAKFHPFDCLADCKHDMKSRFELDDASAPHGPEEPIIGESMNSASMDAKLTIPEMPVPETNERQYVDPESLDASEQDFAISLDESAVDSRFIVEAQHPDDGNASDAIHGECPEISSIVDLKPDSKPNSKQRELLEFSERKLGAQADAENSWRQEVSARLSKYQSRRRLREPRYPSLQLKFETQVASPGSDCQVDLSSGFATGTSVLAKSAAAMDPLPGEVPPQQLLAPSLETAARVLEFPRCSTAPLSHSEELAEPVFDRPRIMEAPDLVPPVPALGGILMEPAEAPANEKRPGFEMPLQAARMATRLAATLIDGLIVLGGVALSAGIFWRITALMPSIRLSAVMGTAAAALFWAAYQYLFLVHCGTTPGLKAAKLKLSHFDGSSVPRKMRRWRVFASILSGLSLALGYAWCFLDEDQLCWHDRITRTYVAPNA
jgi:uncharacterized RDD family membrane protein YckC